jgi:isoleucyl-tRNA synthetase
VPATTIRAAARELAYREIQRQREEFQEFGIMADWSPDGCYRTLGIYLVVVGKMKQYLSGS